MEYIAFGEGYIAYLVKAEVFSCFQPTVQISLVDRCILANAVISHQGKLNGTEGRYGGNMVRDIVNLYWGFRNSSQDY